MCKSRYYGNNVLFVNPENAIKKSQAGRKKFDDNLQSTAPLPKQFLHKGLSIIPFTADAFGTKIGMAQSLIKTRVEQKHERQLRLETFTLSSCMIGRTFSWYE